MKRSGPPKRRAPLQRTDWIRTGAAKPRTVVYVDLHRRARSLKAKPLPAAERRRRAEVRAAVFARDGGCLMGRLEPDRCFGRETFHHLRKDGQGGAYDEENGVDLCVRHNDDVEDDPDRYRRLGLVVGKGVTPEEAAELREAAGLGPNRRPR